jgi:hypothetical protein
MDFEEFSTLKKKPCILLWNNRKDALRAPQELANCTHGKLRDMKA